MTTGNLLASGHAPTELIGNTSWPIPAGLTVEALLVSLNAMAILVTAALVVWLACEVFRKPLLLVQPPAEPRDAAVSTGTASEGPARSAPERRRRRKSRRPVADSRPNEPPNSIQISINTASPAACRGNLPAAPWQWSSDHPPRQSGGPDQCRRWRLKRRSPAPRTAEHQAAETLQRPPAEPEANGPNTVATPSGLDERGFERVWRSQKTATQRPRSFSASPTPSLFRQIVDANRCLRAGGASRGARLTAKSTVRTNVQPHL